MHVALSSTHVWRFETPFPEHRDARCANPPLRKARPTPPLEETSRRFGETSATIWANGGHTQRESRAAQIGSWSRPLGKMKTTCIGSPTRRLRTSTPPLVVRSDALGLARRASGESGSGIQESKRTLESPNRTTGKTEDGRYLDGDERSAFRKEVCEKRDARSASRDALHARRPSRCEVRAAIPESGLAHLGCVRTRADKISFRGAKFFRKAKKTVFNSVGQQSPTPTRNTIMTTTKKPHSPRIVLRKPDTAAGTSSRWRKPSSRPSRRTRLALPHPESSPRPADDRRHRPRHGGDDDQNASEGHRPRPRREACRRRHGPRPAARLRAVGGGCVRPGHRRVDRA